MMKEKRKGLLQRGIMVAVSALTIVAGAGTVLEYEPMQSSDASFEDIVFEPDAEEITIRNSDIVTTIDFSKSDNVFIYLDGTQLPIDDDYNASTYALCTHSMVKGYVTAHKKNSSGGCSTKVYTCQRCEKCGYVANAVYSHTVTYAKCPH